MNKSNNWKTGQIGENLAAKFLEKIGYEIISRNYRTRFGEIDIIAKTKVKNENATKNLLSSDVSQGKMPNELVECGADSQIGHGPELAKDFGRDQSKFDAGKLCGRTESRFKSRTANSEPQNDKEIYIFVEVKTKIGDQFGTPEEMISSGKIAKVLKMASVYLTKEGLGEPPCRLDAVAIILDDEMKVISLHHYPCIT